MDIKNIQSNSSKKNTFFLLVLLIFFIFFNKIFKRFYNIYLRKREEKLRKRNYAKRKSEIKKIAKKVTSDFNTILSTNLEKQTTKTLENMIVMGDIIKDEILIEKSENPEKFVDIEKSLKNENDDNFAISLLAKDLEKSGIVTAVEKTTDKEDIDVAATNLQFMINGLATKKKLDVHFDYGKEKNNKILNDPIEQKNFLENWKKKPI
jgi:hypothetical protein